MFWETRVPITRHSSKQAFLAYSGLFCMILVTEFGSRCDPNVSGNLGVRLLGTREKSQFWPIVTSFEYYYSLILGPAPIRMFHEPWGPVTWNSSKHVVLSYSGQFCILLLTDFGPAAIRTFREPRCPVT